jgi:hypothetical protein
VTALEDRLRTDLRAESDLIEPGSIPALELPAQRPGARGRPRTGGPRRRPAWMTGLAAAAAVIAVVAVVLTIAGAIGTTRPRPAPDSANPALPPYYAYAVQGSISGSVEVGARYAEVRATTTGRLLDTVSPPRPYDAFESFTAAASGRTFVFAAKEWRTGTPKLFARNQRTPLKFLILTITPAGHPRLAALRLPQTLTEGQQPTIALSPDGTRLAVAYGGSGKPAVVQVVTLATGQMRQWVSPPPAPTPVLTGPGTWTSNGRVLAIGQMVTQPGGVIQSTPVRVRLLDTTVPGTNLAAGRLLTLPQADPFPWPYLTPDGAALVSDWAIRPLSQRPAVSASGVIHVFSAATGSLLRAEARWRWHGPGAGRVDMRPRPVVAWSNASGSTLLVELPRGQRNELGFVTGDTFTPLTHVAVAPLLAAMSSGGFQTSGGYVGFAW